MPNKIIFLIFFSIFLITVRSQCSSTSCGTGGQCLGNLCNCGSDFIPSDNNIYSCSQSPVCSAPVDYSNTSHLVPYSAYDPNFDSNFGVGNWELTLKYSQAKSMSRNIIIYSRNGSICKDFSDDLINSPTSANFPWLQTIDNTNGNDQCTDVVKGNFAWTQIADCLRSQTNEFLYEGNLVSISSLSDVNYNQTQYGKRVGENVADFQTMKAFSFDFQASIQTNNSDYTFDLRYGTTITILTNTTDDPNKNASCLLDFFADHFNYPRNLFLVDVDIDQLKQGYQNFSFIILDNDQYSSTDIANSIVAYINTTIVSCKNVSTVLAIVSAANQKILFRLISNRFDSSTLKLTLVYDLKITDPIKANSSYSFNGPDLPPNIVTIGSDNCANGLCDQSVTMEFDLSQVNCTGLSRSTILILSPVCKTGGNAEICSRYLGGINGKKINLPISFTASWCPIQQKTSLSKNFFRIFANGNALQNGDTLTTTRSINGRISVNIDSKVSGSVLQSADITQLVLTDGLHPFQVSLESITQTFSDQVATFLTQFNHTIDPAITPIDFSRQLYYVATVNAIFTVPTSKRTIGRTFVVRAAPGNTVVPVSSQSSQFQISSPSTKATEPPSSNNNDNNNNNNGNKPSSSVLPMAIGAAAGGSGLFIFIVVAVVVVRRRKNKGDSESKISPQRFNDDVEMNSISIEMHSRDTK